MAPALIKTYVNADDLEKEAKTTGFIDLSVFGITITLPELIAFHAAHYLLIKKGLNDQADRLSLLGSCVDYRDVPIDSYFASVIADLIRQRLLDEGISFTFETVMSHPGKVDFMREAQARGYRTYLYFVSTDNPGINVDRVAIRVQEGGHPVEPSKIRERYVKSLNLLPQAVAASDRAYIFDNSGTSAVVLAEVTGGTQLQYRTEDIPDWFFQSYVDPVGG